MPDNLQKTNISDPVSPYRNKKEFLEFLREHGFRPVTDAKIEAESYGSDQFFSWQEILGGYHSPPCYVDPTRQCFGREGIQGSIFAITLDWGQINLITGMLYPPETPKESLLPTRVVLSSLKEG